MLSLKVLNLYRNQKVLIKNCFIGNTKGVVPQGHVLLHLLFFVIYQWYCWQYWEFIQTMYYIDILKLQLQFSEKVTPTCKCLLFLIICFSCAWLIQNSTLSVFCGLKFTNIILDPLLIFVKSEFTWYSILFWLGEIMKHYT
jgi:hypothetical protein